MTKKTTPPPLVSKGETTMNTKRIFLLACLSLLIFGLVQILPTNAGPPAPATNLQGIIAVIAGGHHTCALTNSGQVKCWGWNLYGQLGDGTTIDRYIPVDVVGLTSGVTAIAAGQIHTCALTASGGVRCWGWNGYGQLGDGTTIDRYIPVDVVGLTSGIKAIASGGYHTCALTDIGQVKCWGYNWGGQLGDGTGIDQHTPVDVVGLTSEVTTITAGNLHTCALTSNGQAKCWGWNQYGLLGDGTTINRYAPVDVVGLTSAITAIADGNADTCALTNSGGAKCWGWNRYGEIGDGTDIRRYTPVDVLGLTSGITAITAGTYYACALTNSGGATCWGENLYGKLGDGTGLGRYTPLDVVGLTSGVTAITAGLNHTCALTSNGQVKCWGWNEHGQIGDGTGTDRYAPVNVVEFSSTPTPTPTETNTPTPTSTSTATPSSTPTALPSPTPTPTFTSTPTSAPTPTASPTPMPSPTPTSVPSGKTPIVFVHGWLGAEVPVGCTDADKIRRESIQEAKDYWQRAGDRLKVDGGYADSDIFYAQLVSNPCWTPSLEDNVQYLEEAIGQAKTITGQPNVIVIAHSMGGLVSRAYIEGNTYQNDVAEIFTFGSPHLGIPSDLLTFLANGASIGSFCNDFQPVACELSVFGMELFNKDHHSKDNITYHLISGDAPLFSRNALGKLTDALIAGGDDGIVSTFSGLGLSGSLDRFQTDETHGPGPEVFGPRTYFIRDGGTSTSYDQCLKKILIDGFTTCGNISTLKPTVQQEPDLDQHTPLEFGLIHQGEVVTRTLSLEEGPTLFADQWETGTISMTLISPNNQVIDAGYALANPTVVSYTTDATAATYYFPNAQQGEWKVVLQGVGVPVSGTTYSTFAAFDSTTVLTGNTDKPWYTPGTIATITATLVGLPTSAIVTATILRSDDLSDTLTLGDTGGGNNQGSYLVPNSPGYTEIRLVATGVISGGLPFERGENLIFQISPSTASLTGIYADTPVEHSPGSYFYDGVSITVGISTTTTGALLELFGDLADGQDNVIAHALTTREVTTQTMSLTLFFSGGDIFASTKNGPYRLTNLLLTDKTGPALVLVEATDVYQTSSYDYQRFGDGKLYLPLIQR